MCVNSTACMYQWTQDRSVPHVFYPALTTPSSLPRFPHTFPDPRPHPVLPGTHPALSAVASPRTHHPVFPTPCPSYLPRSPSSSRSPGFPPRPLSRRLSPHSPPRLPYPVSLIHSPTPVITPFSRVPTPPSQLSPLRALAPRPVVCSPSTPGGSVLPYHPVPAPAPPRHIHLSRRRLETRLPSSVTRALSQLPETGAGRTQL